MVNFCNENQPPVAGLYSSSKNSSSPAGSDGSLDTGSPNSRDGFLPFLFALCFLSWTVSFVIA